MTAFVELRSADHDRILPLCKGAGSSFPLIRAVVERQQPGRILVDSGRTPSSAFILNRFGFCAYVGSSANRVFNDGLSAWLGKRSEPSYLLWYDPPLVWQDTLRALPVSARCRQRLRFEYLSALTPQSSRLPAGFAVRPLDRSLLARTEAFNLDISGRFWPSADAFLREGIGVCIMKDDIVVSVCYSACVAGGRAEIDIATLPEYRNQGLGLVAAQCFIQECIKREIRATWDCFETNEGSARIARRLGFAEILSYPFYTFNTPLPIGLGNE